MFTPKVAAVTLNLLVLIVSLKNRKLLNHADAFIVSLAASDLGHPLLGYPMVIASSFHHRWIFGYTWCQVNGFLGFLFGTNSMMTLACMSFSRLLSVTRPSTARHRGKCLTFTFLIFAILYAIFWSTCPLLGWGRYDLEPYRTSCTLQWDFPDSSFVTASFIGCLAVPAGVMCVSYGQITALAWQTGKNQRRWNQRKSDKTLNKQELRLLKMTVAMCTVFIVVWTPYAISAMIKSYSRTVHIPIPLTAVPAMAAKCSHVIDPILYFTLNKRFRRFLPGLNKKECTIETGITLQVNNPLRGKEITKVTSLFHETNFEKSKSPKLCDAVNLKCLQRNETEDFSFQIRISAEESFMLNN
ncbi:opsin-5-like isoform X2 [Pomacea canaliculata]|uniref:opsin-5-like isoform X2 n=1 Tax=Pomacea canaliculata TaxID=400727 RepID=UPI000D731322|nr:opsin-5-like isoform X2 [Pomacea canaliculata]